MLLDVVQRQHGNGMVETRRKSRYIRSLRKYTHLFCP